MLDLQKTYTKVLANYIDLAGLESSKAYAWHQVKELAKDHQELFADLPDKVEAAMWKKLSEGQKNSGE